MADWNQRLNSRWMFTPTKASETESNWRWKICKSFPSAFRLSDVLMADEGWRRGPSHPQTPQDNNLPLFTDKPFFLIKFFAPRCWLRNVYCCCCENCVWCKRAEITVNCTFWVKIFCRTKKKKLREIRGEKRDRDWRKTVASNAPTIHQIWMKCFNLEIKLLVAIKYAGALQSLHRCSHFLLLPLALSDSLHAPHRPPLRLSHKHVFHFKIRMNPFLPRQPSTWMVKEFSNRLPHQTRFQYFTSF